jgi:hypothetical protein
MDPASASAELGTGARRETPAPSKSLGRLFGRSLFPWVALALILGTIWWGPWVTLGLTVLWWNVVTRIG